MPRVPTMRDDMPGLGKLDVEAMMGEQLLGIGQGISYSNSAFAKLAVLTFTVKVARWSQILTRTLRPSAIAIRPSLISCRPTQWVRQASSRTRNFLSISSAMSLPIGLHVASEPKNDPPQSISDHDQ